MGRDFLTWHEGMKNLIIICAGGFGREVCNTAPDCYGYGTDFIIRGFLDDTEDPLGKFSGYPPVLGTIDSYCIEPDDVFICANGSVEGKQKCVQRIAGRGGKFISLIHKTATMARNTTLGRGCIIQMNARISCDSRIGNFVTIQDECMMGHDVRIGDWSHLHPRVFLGGGASLGEGAHLFPYSIVHPDRKVGDYASVGAGAFVIRNVKPHETVFGNPAKKL